LIRSYVDAYDFSKGYVYDIAAGASFRIPLTREKVPLQTTASVAGPQQQGWYTGAATVTLQAYGLAGTVGSTVYSLNGGIGWSAYTTPIVLADSGIHTLQYRSTDLAGNVEPTKSATVKIDRLPPSTTALANGTTGENGWYSSAATVALSTYDAHSGAASTEYAVSVTASTYGQQSHGFVPYTGPIPLDEGKYTLQFRSIDAAGNTESVKTADVKIDRTAPSFALLLNGMPIVPGAEVEDSQSIAFTLPSSDGMSGVAQRAILVDGAVYTEGTTFSWAGQTGDHTVKAIVKDYAGNIAATSYSVHVATSPASVMSLIAGYAQSNDLQHSLEVKLANSMRQAEHHRNGGRLDQALHFLDKFLQDVGEQQNGISASAKLTLQANAQYLQRQWNGNS
jgi:hypothetical protein